MVPRCSSLGGNPCIPGSLPIRVAACEQKFLPRERTLLLRETGSPGTPSVVEAMVPVAAREGCAAAKVCRRRCCRGA